MTFGVVADIARQVYARGHNIYIDNYFSSPALFEELDRNGIGTCGTIRLNGNGIPEEAANAKSVKGGFHLYARRKNPLHKLDRQEAVEHDLYDPYLNNPS